MPVSSPRNWSLPPTATTTSPRTMRSCGGSRRSPIMMAPTSGSHLDPRRSAGGTECSVANRPWPPRRQRAGTMIDDLAELMLPDALREMKQAMHDVHPNELTAYEVIALLPVLRQAKARIKAPAAEPARVLTMVRGEKRRNRLA